jgi:hypothetical protein
MVQQTGKGMIETLTKKAKMVRTGEIIQRICHFFSLWHIQKEYYD